EGKSQQASQHTRTGEGKFQVQPIQMPHDGEVGVRHRARQIIDAAAADLQSFCLPGYRQIVLTVDHRFALSNPALVSAPSKKLAWRYSPPVAQKRTWARLLPEGSGRHDFGGIYPVKKHGPWVVAHLRVVTPSGDPV